MLKSFANATAWGALLLVSPALAQTASTAPAPAAATLPDVDPALFVVKDADTTVYLFGTVHVLDGKSAWFNDEVKWAFDKSDKMMVEVILPEKPEEMAPVIMKHAIDSSGKKLSDKLSATGKANLQAALGPQAAMMDMFKPSFVSVTVAMMELTKMGLNPESGAEKVLTGAAKAAGKPVGQLETIDEQMGILLGGDEATHIKMLEEGLAERDQMPGKMRSMMASWAKGDVEGVAKAMDDGTDKYPDFRKRLLTDRNARWANWIVERMKQPGTVFVAVGAGHLAGHDSVQAQLKAKGIKSERVPHRDY